MQPANGKAIAMKNINKSLRIADPPFLVNPVLEASQATSPALQLEK